MERRRQPTRGGREGTASRRRETKEVLSSLVDLGQEFSRSSNEDALLAAYLETVQTLLDCGALAVYVLDPANGYPLWTAGVNFSEELIERLSPIEGMHPLSWLLFSEKTLILDRLDDAFSNLEILVGGVLRHKGRPFGLLLVGFEDKAAFEGGVRKRFESLLGFGGVVLDREGTASVSEAALSELSVLYDLGKYINSSLELEQIAEATVGAVGAILRMDRIGFLMMENDDEMRVWAGVEMDDAVLARIRKSLEADVEEKMRFDSPSERSYKLSFTDGKEESALFIAPIAAEGRNVGLLVATRRSPDPRYYDQYTKLLSLIASEASDAVSNALRYRWMLNQKLTDFDTLYKAVDAAVDSRAVYDSSRFLIEIFVNLVGADGGGLFLEEPHSGEWVSAVVAGREGFSFAPVDPVVEKINVAADAAMIPLSDEDRRRLGFSPSVTLACGCALSLEGSRRGVFAAWGMKEAMQRNAEEALSVLGGYLASSLRTTRSLLHLQHYMRDIMNSIPSGVLLVDRNGEIVVFNRAASAILGISETEGKIEDHLVGTPFFKDLLNWIHHGEILRHEEISYHNNDEEIVLNVSMEAFRGEENRLQGHVVIFSDVTERKMLRERIRRAERLAAMGTLSMGLAHEIKNPLTSIKGFTQLLPEKGADENFRKKYTTVVESEVERLNALVEKLLVFGRPEKAERRPVDVKEIFDKVVTLTGARAERRGIEMLLEIHENLPAVMGDASQLEQVLLNLILNAIGSMPDGGKLKLKARRPRDDRQVELTVADTGVGIEKQALEQIFDPFYTTREDGTGLGLSISSRIVEEHGGTIRVESRVGKGTTFIIRLPVIPG